MTRSVADALRAAQELYRLGWDAGVASEYTGETEVFGFCAEQADAIRAQIEAALTADAARERIVTAAIAHVTAIEACKAIVRGTAHDLDQTVALVATMEHYSVTEAALVEAVCDTLF
jgi:hypothetical protein